MSIASRKLTVGDKVKTNFSGKITYHEIEKVKEYYPSQSSIMFSVTPRIPKSLGGWFDADWFEPV